MTRPTLSRAQLDDPAWLASTAVTVPTEAMLALPERAVQFGTGAFLRGFIDAFIDRANARGQFNGRVVAIGSTGSGRDRAFGHQDGLFTLVSRGLVDGALIEERRVVGAVSRALSAVMEWDAVLACARMSELSVVFSNTTEVGITFDPGDTVDAAPPASFPGKLTRFLLERARTFDFSPAHGVLIVPCELVVQNGTALRALVQRYAGAWQLDPQFTTWLDAGVTFCNTLVDRIVPGTPTDGDARMLAESLGYDDALLTTAEHFRQFVIEGDQQLAERLGFVHGEPGIVVTADIAPFRERKVRLLNGTHSISAAAALLAGCVTVRDAMLHPGMRAFIRRVLLDDIVPTLDVPDAEPFARDVLDRFENPFIRHALFDITLQATTKLRVRIVPTLLRAADMRGAVPDALAFGVAAHLLFLRGDLQQRRRRDGLGVPPDDVGERIHDAWRTTSSVESDRAALHGMMRRILGDTDMWGTDLSTLPMFVDAVTLHLSRIMARGIDDALAMVLTAEVS